MGFDRLALERLTVRVGAIFPGQGSQAVGMGGKVAEYSIATRDLFARAERVLGYDLRAIVASGPEETLRETQFAQPAIYVVNYALALAAGDSLPVVASAGHSFAELCSLTLAGALDFTTALELVRERGLAMQAAAQDAPGAMAAVLALDATALREAVSRAREFGRVQLANFNAPAQIVISGDRDAVAKASELALAAGAKRVVPLAVSGAWHSELMLPARERFAPLVARANIGLPQFTVISSVDAQPYRDIATIKANLVRSVTDEVLWHATAERLIAEDLEYVVEFGGTAVLAPMVKRLTNAPTVQHVGDERGLEKLGAAIAVA